MKSLSLRTRVLNILRFPLTSRWLEPILLRLAAGRAFSHPIAKALPSHYLYRSPTHRRALRHGIVFDLDIGELIDWATYFGFSEPSRERLLSLVKPGVTVIDVGANVGTFSLPAALAAGPNGRVVGFEPHMPNFLKCQRNISLNALSNVTLHRCALGANSGFVNIRQEDSLNSGSAGISGEYEADETSCRVPMTTLDRYCAEAPISRLDILKIDVEGFESRVIQGAVETLRRDHPTIFIEVDDHLLRRCGSSASSLLAQLRALGYTPVDAATRETLPPDGNLAGCHFDALCD